MTENADKLLTSILELGRRLIEYGAEVWLAEDVLRRIFDSYGFKSCDMQVMSDFIEATVETRENKTRTQIRETRGKNYDMYKLEQLSDLTEYIIKEKPAPEYIQKKINEISKGACYSKPVLYLAAAFSAGNFTMMFNGWRQDVFLVALFSLLIVLVKDHLSQKEDNPLITNTLLAYLMEVMVVAALLYGPGRSLTSMTAGLIMLLIGGLGLTNGMMDLLHRNVLSGLNDFMHSILGAMGIAIGISLALMTFRQGVMQHVQHQELVQSQVVQMIATIGGCLGFAVCANCRGRVLIVSWIGAALTRTEFVITLDMADGNYFTATLAAAFFAALFSYGCGMVRKRPPTIFLTTCILPLLPGSQLYLLVYAIIMDDRLSFQENGRSLFLICIAIALGCIIVEVLFKYGRMLQLFFCDYFRKKKQKDIINEAD